VKNELILFYSLIFSHLVADYFLQFSVIAKRKNGFNKYMIIHSFTAAALFFIPLFNYPFVKSLIGSVIVFLSHILIDNLKNFLCNIFKTTSERSLFYVFTGIDQILHVTVILLVFVFLLL